MLNRCVRNLVLILILLFSYHHSFAKLKSYRDWKAEKVSECQLRIQTLKGQIEQRKKDTTTKKSDSLNDLGLNQLEQKLQLEQYYLELASDLSVTDYFVGYLNKVENKQAAFKELAQKLTPDEVAEIMTAYANSVFGSREVPEKADLSPSASNLKN